MASMDIGPNELNFDLMAQLDSLQRGEQQPPPQDLNGMSFTPQTKRKKVGWVRAMSSGLTQGENLPRYPSLSPGGLLRAGDYLGTAVFAMGGAVCAGRGGMDLWGSMILGLLTATGGGTIRDLILGGQQPVFWLQEQEYLGISLAVAAVTHFAWPTLHKFSWLSEGGGADDGPLLRWLDTIGLGAFAVIGTTHGIRRDFNPVATLMIAAITCSGGGIMRDVLLRAPARVLHSHAEVYVGTALLGSMAYMLTRLRYRRLLQPQLVNCCSCSCKQLHHHNHNHHHWAPSTCRFSNPMVRMAAGVLATVVARVLAWTYDLRLPELKL
ncbi:unnamed protein product [Chrysoparadoxa australica]